MNYILTMTLSGSCMLLLYFCQKYTIGKYLPKRWQYLILKTVMLYYMVPLPFLGAYYKAEIGKHSTRPSPPYVTYFPDETVLYQAGNSFCLSRGYRQKILAACLWCLMALAIFAIQFVRYAKTYREMLQCRHTSTETTDAEVLHRKKGMGSIRREVSFCPCRKENTAFTMGIRKPVIIGSLPEDPLEKEMLLEHELAHIKRVDTLWKMAGTIVLGLHWFNPLAHIFLKEFDFICEESCDELVVGGRTEEECRRYAIMLVERSKGQPKAKGWEIALSENAKKIYERAVFAMECKNRKYKWNGIVCALLTCIMVALNSATVLAYEEVKVMPVESEEVLERISTSRVEMEFAVDWNVGHWVDIVLYDEQFEDEHGNIYPIGEDMETYASCSHSYVPGITKDHSLDADGSCSMDYYESQRCSKCGNVIVGELIGSSSFTKCIH